MRLNFKRFLNSILLIIFCIFSVSCSLISTGNIQFKLPTLEQPCNYGIALASEQNQTDFCINLTSINGKVIYSERHEPGTLVSINNVPVGRYDLTFEAVTSTDIYDGNEKVFVKAGRGASVNVRLNKNPINFDDGKIYGCFSGTVDDYNITDKVNFEMYVRVYKQDGNRTKVSEQKVNNSFSYKTPELEVGNYILCFSGRDTDASYYQEKYISNMKEGANELASIPLTRSSIQNIKLSFTKGPLPAEKLHIRLLTNGGVEFLSTDIMSDEICHFDNLPGGYYLVCAESENWEVNNYEIVVDKDETFGIELQLKNK